MTFSIRMAFPFSPYLERETETTMSTVEPRRRAAYGKKASLSVLQRGFCYRGVEEEKNLNACSVLRASGDMVATYGFPGPLVHLTQLCPRAEGAVRHSVPDYYL